MNVPFELDAKAEALRTRLMNPRKPPSSIRTLVELVQWQADTRGDSLAFTHLPDQSVTPRELTFSSLDQRARAIAVALREHGKHGDRVLIVQQPGLEYVASLLGAMYAGMISVPVYPPDLFRLRQTLPRLQAITSEADAQVMLSSREILGHEVGPLWQLCKDAALATDEIPETLASSWQPPNTTKHDIALLQYTSGSTGNPRGVALAHANLMANAEQGFYAFDVPDAVCVFWLPPYHDLGLIGGMLIPLFGGRHSVLMSPIAFVQEPLRWFRAITHYRGTTTASPNFGYEWCIRKIDPSACEGIDLSSLRLAAVGAEPIRSATLKRFAEKFAPLGFSASAFTPGYGMAEATLAVTNKPLDTMPVIRTFDRAALMDTPAAAVPVAKSEASVLGTAESNSTTEASVDLVSSGRPVVGCEVRIVDPITGEQLADGQIGEIWIRSPGVAQGYWQKPNESRETFGAKLRAKDNAQGAVDWRASELPENLSEGLERVDGYLRSGDLGFRMDGELFVSGRLKEQIIIAGRNFFPHDIEAAIQTAHEAFKVDGGIAFSVDRESGEELVIVHEVLRPKRFDMGELIKVILQTVFDQFSVVPHAIRLVTAASLPKTSSGKLRRLDCRSQFLNNELQVLHQWDSENAAMGDSAAVVDAAETSLMDSINGTSQQLEAARIWCEVLDLDTPKKTQHFLEVGGHSLAAQQLIARMREEIGLDFSVSDLFQFPTLGELLDEVARRSGLGGETQKTKLDRLTADQPLPLTDTQQAFWWLDQLGRTDAFLRVGITLHGAGRFESDRLAEACRTLAQRHPGLCTRFFTGSDGLPRQQLLDSLEVPLEVFDLTGMTESQQTKRIENVRSALADVPFDLSQPPLIRIALCLTSTERFQLIIVGHHIVCDGFSLWLIAEDLVRFLGGSEVRYTVDHWLDSLARHATSHVAIDAAKEASVAYWNTRLKDVATDQSLGLASEVVLENAPGAGGTDMNGSGRSKVRWSQVDQSQAQKVGDVAVDLKVTPFSIYTTLWHAVLDAYRPSGDLVFGIPLANRIHSTEERVVGAYISTVPFRTDFLQWMGEADEKGTALPTNGVSTRELRANICKTHQQWLEDLRHSELSLERIIESLDLQRDGGTLPLIRHLVLHQPMLEFDCAPSPLEITDYETDYSSLAAYETAFVVESHPKGPKFGLVYDPRRIDPSIASMMLDSFLVLLHRLVLEDPGSDSIQQGGAIDVARTQLMSAVVGRCPLSEPIHFLRLFEAQVKRSPKSIAVCGEDRELSYQALDRESSRIALSLSKMGIEPETIVAVNVSRTTKLLSLLLGIWKAGAAYLPIDPRHPEARVHEILADAQPICWVDESEEPLAFVPNAPRVRHVRFSDLWKLADSVEECSLDIEGIPSDGLAYLIYTSGSTGKPKGVAVSHTSVSNLLRSFARQPGLHRGESILASTTISFDISVLELFLPLAVGGTCVLACESLSEDPEAVLRILDDRAIDLVQGTPSSLRLLRDIGWVPQPGMRVWCGGEAMSPELARELLALGVELWNVYGPTETTVWSLIHRVTECDLAKIPIGQPIDSTKVVILDHRHRVVPIGVTGELCIGGQGLARGYWNIPDLTSERFFDWHSRFSGDADGDVIRLYRTGDLARWMPNGDIEFLGRRDRQVKLLGHRIELGEIEAAITSFPGISIAAVTVTSRDDGPQRLVGFYTAQDGLHVSHEEILNHLRQRLPTTMVPTVMIPLAVMPTTPAGKVDYQSLPLEQCVLRVGDMDCDQPDALCPRDEIEQTIANVWCEVLKRDSVGVHDNFFHLGGHSLAAAQVFSRLRPLFDAEIPLREVYQRPTIAGLAAWYRGETIGGGEIAHAADNDLERSSAGGGEDVEVAGFKESPSDSRLVVEELPLSFAEERLWVVEQVEPNHPFYNLPLAAEVCGAFDIQRFGRALQACIQRHETLRSTYHWHHDAPRRCIHANVEVIPSVVDLCDPTAVADAVGAKSADEILQALMREESRKTFGLEVGPLLRVVVYKLSPERHVILLVMHHIISDGWSMWVLLSELAEFYRADQSGESPGLPSLAVTYSDYARLQQDAHRDSEQHARDLRYWTRNLDGCTETLDLPTDFERPPVQTFDGATCPLCIDERLANQIEELSTKHQVTPFMVFLAAYVAVISRYTRQTDFNIGSAVANRPETELEKLIGFFVSTIVIRAQIDGTPTFLDLLEQIKWTAIEGFAHAALPFEELVKHFGKTRDRSHSPMFQAAFVMQNAPRDFASAPGIDIRPMHVDNGTAKYDLTLFLWKQEQAYAGHLEYRSNLFRESTIEQFSESYQSFLEGAVRSPEQTIDAIPIVALERQAEILQRSVGPQRKFEGPDKLHELIEYRVAQLPQHLAVIYRDERWSYEELWKRVRSIARGLQRLSNHDRSPVIVYLPRSFDQLAAQIAVNCCGAAFVPIDTNFPAERVAAIAADIRANWVITNEALAEGFEGVSFQCCTIEKLVRLDDTQWERVSVEPDDPAYLIFTSGSTGQPKGVVVEHHSICNFVHCFCDAVGMTKDDRCSHTLSPSFDGALSESLTTLTRGATLVIIDAEDVVDPRNLTAILRKHAVTFGAYTPPILAGLDPQQLPALRRVLSGGAKLNLDVAQRWLTNRAIFNGYGPTECTVGSAIQEMALPIGRHPAVGRPMANMSMYILDGNMQFVPDGVPGEVFIGGGCVAREYWNQPTLTKDRFVEDPFISKITGTELPRMYRTGDLGRWNSQGLIEILGRCDDQIKLRGYRIEPGEISSVLDSLPEVQGSAVVAWGDVDDVEVGQRLIAYVVPSDEFSHSASSIEQEHVESWRDLFDESQNRSSLALRPEDNFAGWQSVLTGRAIDPKLMAQWADATAKRISDLKPSRILEVGCGTGLILLRLRPEFNAYVGIDLLGSALDQLRHTLENRPHLAEKVTLEQRSADSLGDLATESFDTVVLNSVVQYFPSFEYLIEVLKTVVDLTERGGRIFLGDLRDLRLQAAFALEVELLRATGENVDAAQLKRRVFSRIEHDEELLLDPRLFRCLHRYLPRIADVSIQYKVGDDANELNRYRYDAILQLDNVERSAGLEKFPYSESPWVDRNGNLREPQVLWACLTGSTREFGVAELVRDGQRWLETARSIDAVEELAREEGYGWKNIDHDFDSQRPYSWTNHPMERRKQLAISHRLREQLKTRLPDYMIPSAFVLIESLPKTVQGKIDKGALPPPPNIRPQGSTEMVLPRDEHEKLIASIWESLLEISPIGVEDDFFSLGGHSMLAVRMVNELAQQSGVQIPLATLFRQPTVANLAQWLKHPKEAKSASSIVRLNRTETGVPLYCVHPAGGTAFCYRELAALLESERPVFGVQARGVDGSESPHQDLVEMAIFYAEAIRENTGLEACDLLGWSIGGNIAFEVARQLRQMGVDVRMTYLLDAGLISGETEMTEDDFLPLISALFPDETHQSLEELRMQSPEQQAHYFITQASKAGILPVETDVLGMDIFQVFQANLKAVHNYRITPQEGTFYLVRPRDQSKTADLFEDSALGWEQWVTEVMVDWVPGDHAGMLRGEAVAKIAERLRV